MRYILTLAALLLLAQCKTFHLPKPGEPVRGDIDERARQQDAARDDSGPEPSNRYSDAGAQSAFDAGYSAGYLDHQRGKSSDPDAQIGKVDAQYRTPFVAGYVAGFSK